MSTATWIIWIAWIVIGFTVLYKMAQSRGRNPIGWGVFGAITFLIALIAILIAGPSKDRAPA
jgi:ABC-type Co2+ transport system permease subunit